MDRDKFIIRIFLIVCEQYRKIVQSHPIRQRGFPPKLSDEEVITMEVCGEYFGANDDNAIYEYFSTHYRHFFPALSGRPQFVRQAANLWQVKMLIQSAITQISGEADDPFQIIDTMPMPVCVYTRSQRDRCFQTDADYGYCSAKEMHYYGFKLGLRISRNGMILHYPLLPARPHDVQLLGDLLDDFSGVAIADKGFIDAWRQEQLATKRAIELVTPSRKNMAVHLPCSLRPLCRRLRKRIETVGSQLTERFQIDCTRAHDLWHYQHRLIRKILSHTLCVFINLLDGQPPLRLDALLSL